MRRSKLLILAILVLLLGGCAAEQTTRVEWKRGQQRQEVREGSYITNIYRGIIITNISREVRK
jgi:hypothetical protein